MSELLKDGRMTTDWEQLYHSKRHLEQLKESLNKQDDPYRILTVKEWLFHRNNAVGVNRAIENLLNRIKKLTNNITFNK